MTGRGDRGNNPAASEPLVVGHFEVLPLVDGEGSFATVEEVFPELEGRSEAWELPIQAVLIRSPDGAVLVDTGLGPQPRDFMPETASTLLHQLEPESVDVVIHTHLHVDHVGWDGVFPRARYVVHREDWSFFMAPWQIRVRPHLHRLEPLREEGLVDLVGGETEVVPGIRVLPSPGHTPGHMHVRIEHSGAAAVVLGDVAVHPEQLANPRLAYASDGDAAMAAETRIRVLGEAADEGVPVVLAHLRGAGRIVRDGERFEWQTI
jgi:glyoxylase-like metal-dependent hydrolase (beta-lactamase superfamily II)